MNSSCTSQRSTLYDQREYEQQFFTPDRVRISNLPFISQSLQRVDHSAETALLEVLMVSDSGLISDLRAAFDAAEHNVLLQRFEHTVGIKSLNHF